MICNQPELMPCRQTKGSAGYDFFAPDTYELGPDNWTTIDTGVRFDKELVQVGLAKKVEDRERYYDLTFFSLGWRMELYPRSSFGIKYGFKFRNTVPIIDMDYKDNIVVVVQTEEPFTLNKGERFMQGIISIFGVFADEIEPTKTRKGGFGSTGVKE